MLRTTRIIVCLLSVLIVCTQFTVTGGSSGISTSTTQLSTNAESATTEQTTSQLPSTTPIVSSSLSTSAGWSSTKDGSSLSTAGSSSATAVSSSNTDGSSSTTAGSSSNTSANEVSSSTTEESSSTSVGSSSTTDVSSSTTDGSSSTTDISSSTTDILSSTIAGSSSTTEGSSSITDGSSSTTDISSSTTAESSSSTLGSSSTIAGSSSTTESSTSTTDYSSSTTEFSSSTPVQSSTEVRTTSSVERTTVSTSLPFTTDPLKSSVNISSLLMHITANLSVSGSGLTYNDSSKWTLVQEFVAEMNKLLGNTTGFREIRVTRVNGLEWFRSYRRNRSSTDSSIVFDFDLFFLGGSNLSSVKNSLRTTGDLILLNMTANVTDWNSLKDAVTEAERKLNEDVCLVYPSVEKCNTKSYKCRLSNDMITCTHVCHNYDRCGDNGQCYFDDIHKDTMCRCKEDGARYYTGLDCSVEAYKLALSLGAVIGISAGLGGALLLVILVLAVRIIRNRKETRGKEKSSNKLSGLEQGRESPWELKHYDDVWQHRQWRTEGEANSFSERPYMATLDSLGNPMYRPDDRNEHPYSELKPGSSLSNLNLPESKFEIRRPKIVIGR